MLIYTMIQLYINWTLLQFLFVFFIKTLQTETKIQNWNTSKTEVMQLQGLLLI